MSILIKVRRELVELANRMVELGLARSRFHAFNIMIEKGLRRVVEGVELWEGVLREGGGAGEAGLQAEARRAGQAA